MRIVVCCCGTLLDMDTVPNHSKKLNRPGQYCPACLQPLNDLAMECCTSHEANNPADKKDVLRATLREQLAADVRAIHNPEHSPLALLAPAAVEAEPDAGNGSSAVIEI